uniref:UmuC domain-containing protein n=1 Tax=Macrostomum lignano TaxID=282301 RepID=A0A1I8F2Y3_9PLAT
LREGQLRLPAPVLVRGGLLQLCGSGLRRSQRQCCLAGLRELCPELVAVPYEFEAYEAASSQLYRLLGEFTHSLQAVSCDELFVDCGELLRETRSVACPAGLSGAQGGAGADWRLHWPAAASAPTCWWPAWQPSRPSRTASGAAGPGRGSPNCCATCRSRELPGLDARWRPRLTSLGFGTCGLLRGAQVSALGRELGPRVAQTLLECGQRARRPAGAGRARAEMLRRRRRNSAATGVCNTVNKSVALPLDTDDARLLLQECMIIVRQLRLAPQDMRGLGIHMTRLVPATTGSGGSGSSGGGGRSMDISRFAKKAANFRFYVRRHFRFYACATSVLCPAPLPFYVRRHFRSKCRGPLRSMSGATSGSMSGATSGSNVWAPLPVLCLSALLLAPVLAIPSWPVRRYFRCIRCIRCKTACRKASSNCYSNDRNKVTGKANFFANAAGPSLIEDEEGDERADSPAVPSAADCTQYDLSSALFDSGAPQIDEDFLAALPDSMATAIRAQLRDRDQNRDRDQDRDQVVPLPAASQLSQSCLAALPPEIRAELDAAYAAEERQRLRRQQQPPPPPPPLRKAGRGRPKGSRNRTHAAPAGGAAGLAGKSGVSRTAPQSSRKKPGVKQLTVAEMFRRPQTAPPSPPPLPPRRRHRRLDSRTRGRYRCRRSGHGRGGGRPPRRRLRGPPPLLLRPPSLCGRGRRLADLRRLLTDWTASAESPRPADERLLLRFFLAHLPDHLTRLYRLVRHFKSVAEAAGGGWAAACARLVAAQSSALHVCIAAPISHFTCLALQLLCPMADFLSMVFLFFDRISNQEAVCSSRPRDTQRPGLQPQAALQRR